MMERLSGSPHLGLLLVGLLALSGCPHTGVHAAHVHEEERIIGWKGETFDRKEVFGQQSMGVPASLPWVETHSFHPRLQLYHQLLQPSDRAHLLRLAASGMKLQTTKNVDGTFSQSYVRELRAASSTDAVVGRLMLKVANWTMVHPNHQTDLIIERLDAECLQSPAAQLPPDNSVAAAVMTLAVSDDLEGGEVSFPSGERLAGPGPGVDPHNVICNQEGVSVSPEPGSVLVVKTRALHGPMDKMSSLRTCPVTAGVLYRATFKIMKAPLLSKLKPKDLSLQMDEWTDAGICSDVLPSTECAKTVSQGRCKSDAEETLCRVSCGFCVECYDQSQPCYKANLAMAGYIDLGEELAGILVHLEG